MKDKIIRDSGRITVVSYGDVENLSIFLSAGRHHVKMTDTVSSLNFSNGVLGKGKVYLNVARIGDMVTTLEDGCFKDCVNLSSVIASDNIEYVGDDCFSNCSAMAYTDILDNRDGKSSLHQIGDRAFISSGITYAVIQMEDKEWESPDGQGQERSFIGDRAFKDCKKLQQVSISGLGNMGNEVFSGCSALQTFDIQDSGFYWGYGVFRDCESLEGMRIPANVTTIPDDMFNGCKAFEYLDIEDSEEQSKLTYLGNRFLSGTNVEFLRLPRSISSTACFSENAFGGSNIKQLTLMGFSSMDIATQMDQYQKWSFYTNEWSYPPDRDIMEKLIQECLNGDGEEENGDGEEKNKTAVCLLFTNSQMNDRNSKSLDKLLDKESFKTFMSNNRILFIRCDYKDKNGNLQFQGDLFQAIANGGSQIASGFYEDKNKKFNGAFPTIMLLTPWKYTYKNVEYPGKKVFLTYKYLYNSKSIPNTISSVTGEIPHDRKELVVTRRNDFDGWGLPDCSIYPNDSESPITYEKKVLGPGQDSTLYFQNNQPTVVDNVTTSDFKVGTWYGDIQGLKKCSDLCSVPLFVFRGVSGLPPCQQFQDRVFLDSTFQKWVKDQKYLFGYASFISRGSELDQYITNSFNATSTSDHPTPPDLICYYGEKNICSNRFFTTSQQGYEYNPEIYKKAAKGISDVSSYIHQQLSSGPSVIPERMRHPESGKILEFRKYQKMNRDEGGSPGRDSIEYVQTKMKFYGPWENGYTPQIGRDLSGRFFPCDQIYPQEQPFFVTSALYDPVNLSTRWGPQMELAVGRAISPVANVYPSQRGTYWYQNQNPSDTNQGETGYVFQINGKTETTWSQLCSVPQADISNYQVTVREVGDGEDKSEIKTNYTAICSFVLMDEKVPKNGNYVDRFYQYISSNGEAEDMISCKTISAINDQLYVSWAYRFQN